MSVIDNLITDRQAGSFYNYTDVNRVNEAIMYVAQLLTEAGYPTRVETLPTNWSMTSYYYIEDANRVINALTIVRNQFSAFMASGFPSTFQNLTYEGANQIEQFLSDVYYLLEATKQEWINLQCNTFQSGGILL